MADRIASDILLAATLLKNLAEELLTVWCWRG
jgi:hypothetical protein